MTSTHRVATHLDTPEQRRALDDRRSNGFATPSTPNCRDLEWACAGFMILWSLAMAYPGHSLAAPTYMTFDRWHLGEAFWGVTAAGVGMMRLVALYINGRNPKTPLARCIGAAAGLLFWSQLAIGLAIGSVTALGALSPGSMIYFGLAITEGRSLYRSRYDARYFR